MSDTCPKCGMDLKPYGFTQASELDAPPGSADLADMLARDVMAAGDGPTPCRRIQFKGGKYPDNELDQGGFCESALAKHLRESLARHLPNEKRSNPTPKI